MTQPISRCGRMFKARIFPDAAHLARDLAALLRTELATPPPGPAALLLAGGRTPLAAYAVLAAAPPAVAGGWHLMYSDDRHVPPGDPRSNFGATRPLIAALGLPTARVLRIEGEAPLEDAAARYHHTLEIFLGQGGQIPLGFLGLGADGHTASLFSADQVAAGKGRLAQATARPDGLDGISVTADLLARVGRLIFLVTGADKRARARQLLTAPGTLPAGLAVAGAPLVEVWLDRDAWPLDPDPGRN